MLKKILFRISIIILISGIIIFAIYSWNELEKNYKELEPITNSEIPVLSYTVEKKVIKDWIYAEGTARVNKKAHLTFEVDGRVEELTEIDSQGIVREGIHIKAKDSDGNKILLARLYGKDYSEELLISKSKKIQAERDVDVARAKLEQTESKLKLAEVYFKRIDSLAKSKTISRQKYDEAKSALDVAEAEVISARAEEASTKAALLSVTNSLSQAKRNLSRTKIYAPWDGTIARVNIEENKYFSVNALDISDTDTMTETFPITIIDRSIFKVNLEIPMNRLNGLSPGDPAFIKKQLENSDNNKNLWIPAEVFTVAPILSPKSRTVRVTLKTTAKNPDLIDGELVTGKILSTTKKTLIIPLNAIIYFNNQPYTYVINPETNKVSKRNITTGIRDNLFIEVTNGLKENEKVVTEGRQRLKDTSKIRLLNGVTNE